MTPLAHPAIWLAGYIPDLPTPFDENGGLDLTAFAKLCERQIEAGVPAIVVCEAAGEASRMASIIRAADTTRFSMNTNSPPALDLSSIARD